MRSVWLALLSCSLLACGSEDGEPASGSGGAGSGPWRSEAALPEALSHASALELSGKVWLIGGRAPSASKKVWIFDPTTEAWSSGPELPEARSDAAVAAIDGSVYVVGGYSDEGTTPTDSTYVLASGQSVWEKQSSLILPRADAVAAGIDGLLYVIGGGQAAASLLGDTVVFDPSSKSWAAKAKIPHPRTSFAGFLLGGWLYAMGGATESGGVTNQVDVYEPKGGAWGTATEFPHPRRGAGAAVLGATAFVAGGEGEASVDTFDGKSFGSAPPLATPRTEAAVVSAAGRLYVIGGELAGGGASSVVESYAP